MKQPKKPVSKSGAPISSRPVCVDDFGTAVYRCHFSQRLTWADNCRLVGAFTQVNATYVCHPNSKVDQQISRRYFDERSQLQHLHQLHQAAA